MNVILSLRRSMLEVIRQPLRYASTKQITFYDASSVALANLSYNDVSYVAGLAKMKFTSTGGGNVLRGSVDTAGRPVRFEIFGNVAGPDILIISGTVGSLGSSADIRFNKIDWSEGGIVTLTNLSIVLPNS